MVFLLAMVILFVVAYTFILQQAYTQTALKTEIERDISSADAVHKLVNHRLGRKNFPMIYRILIFSFLFYIVIFHHRISHVFSLILV